ncbi:MAG TPA: helix-turn-helix domain-containing protein [Phycisphaerae bacterium]|nr:helix-turn-helix domain-containing protein [Phycisphaerae bacterium]
MIDALVSTARGLRREVLAAWLPLLGGLAETTRHLSAKSVSLFIMRVRLLRRWSELKQRRPRATNGELDARVAAEARAVDPTLRVSARTVYRWRSAWNATGPGGLAAGPAALFPKYKRPSKAR